MPLRTLVKGRIPAAVCGFGRKKVGRKWGEWDVFTPDRYPLKGKRTEGQSDEVKLLQQQIGVAEAAGQPGSFTAPSPAAESSLLPGR